MMNLLLKMTQYSMELLFILVNFESAGKNATVNQWDHFEKGNLYVWYFS